MRGSIAGFAFRQSFGGTGLLTGRRSRGRASVFDPAGDPAEELFSPYAKLKPEYRGRVTLGNFNAHDGYLDCDQGAGCGGDGFKESILTWHNAWYLALSLNFSIGFGLLTLGPTHYRAENQYNVIVARLFLFCVLLAVCGSAAGIYAVGQSVDNVGFRPAHIMSEYGASHSDYHKNCCLVNLRKRGLPMEADWANVSLHSLVWAAIFCVYLLHGMRCAVLAFTVTLWMRAEMFKASQSRLRQNRALDYLIGRLRRTNLLGSDAEKEKCWATVTRWISLAFFVSWHNVKLLTPFQEDYSDILSLKESIEDVEEMDKEATLKPSKSVETAV